MSDRSTQRRTILIVDDNRDAADTTAVLLEEMGLEALPAYSAREGLDYLDERKDVCLVISDIRMPGVDGFDFVRVVNHRFPQMPTLLTTGLPITEDDVVPRGTSILQKPFAIDDLRRAMSEQLELESYGAAGCRLSSRGRGPCGAVLRFAARATVDSPLAKA